MRIDRVEYNLMVLKDRNITAFVLGIIFLLAGFVVIFKPDFFTNQLPLWLGLVGILLGGFAVAVAKITTVNLDKSINRLTFLRRGLIGKNISEYDLKQIKEVELSVASDTSRKGRWYSYHLAFVLKSGEIVKLNPDSSSVSRVMRRQIIPEKTLGARIASFLGVPFQERRPPTVSESLFVVTSAIQNVAEKEMEKRKE